MTLTLFVYAWGTPIEWFLFSSGQNVQGVLLTQVLLVGFFVHSVVALNGNWHVVRNATAREPLMVAILVLALVSTLWSDVPGVTLQDSLALMVAYIAAMHLVVRFSLREIIMMLGVVFGIGALLNIGFVAIFESLSTLSPSPAGDTSRANWVGITPNRNSLGRLAVFGALFCAMNARLRRSWLIWPGLTLLYVILVFGTNSATSLGALVGIGLLGVVLLGFRGRKTLYGATATAMFAVFSTLAFLAATNLAAATGLLGRNSSFTGRLPIWQNTWEYGILRRPVLGYGWNGFWRQSVNDFDVQLRSNFDVPHAHNAWVDAWLELGPVGLLLLTALYARGLIWATRFIRSNPSTPGMFPALVISLGVIYSVSESGVISRSILVIIFVVALTFAGENKGVKRPFVPGVRRRSELAGTAH